MFGIISACLSLVVRVSQLHEKEETTMAHMALSKSQVTRMCREVVALGREVCGGNGIVSDNWVIKQMMDMEAIYTYEGSYEINSLLVGRGITGLNAFKK